MSHPWRRFTFEGFLMLGRPVQVRSDVTVIAGGVEELSRRAVASEDTSSIIIGVLVCLFVLGLLGIGIFYFLKRRRQAIAGDVESGPEKRNWWMVDSKEKSFTEWWRQSHSIPDRVEGPPNPDKRSSSLQRIRSALTRKGILRGDNDDDGSKGLVIPPVKGVKSPTHTLVLPMQSIPQSKPPSRHPSVSERGYRVPLYPVQNMPVDHAPPRSLTSPRPMSVAERSMKKQVALPPRALSISKGRLVLPRSERKMGLPRSPARKGSFMSQLHHPFMPLKDSDTAFPTISAPMPSQETSATNPKLGYPGMLASQPRLGGIPLPNGPRIGRVNTLRKVPAPVFVPTRPAVPAEPLNLPGGGGGTTIYPPGSSPTVRPSPLPI